MEKGSWDRCPYFRDGHCPYSEAIDRAYLIPDIIAPSELEKAGHTCLKCGNYLKERRKYLRLKKPFKAVMRRGAEGAPAEGQIVNVSGVGALVVLNEWVELHVGEVLQLEIFPRLECTRQSSRGILKAAGRVNRVSRKNREVAVTFLDEIDQDSLYSL